MAIKNPDSAKIKRIIMVLSRNPEGLWLRRLSKESKMPVSTIHYYLENVLNNFVESVGAQDEDGHFFGVRVIRLRNGVFKQVKNGNIDEIIEKLLKTNHILSDLD